MTALRRYAHAHRARSASASTSRRRACSSTGRAAAESTAAVCRCRLGFSTMLARARLLQARVLPHGWLDALRQVSLFAAAYFAYRLVRGLVEGDANAAFAHARDVISIESKLHLFVEPSGTGGASGSHLLMVSASWLYVNAQTSITLSALLYLYLRHNKSFYFVRNMFMIAMVIALVGYIVFPTAPPRFMPEWGFIDSVSDITGVHVSHTSATATALFNPYAAVPSMHVAFALMIGR